MTVSTKDIAWLAGLLEGEGTFVSGKRTSHLPMIQLMMTDKDIVIRAAKIMGANRVTEQTKTTTTGKQVYRTKVFGMRAVSWCMTLYCLMGERRQGKIAYLLQSWKAHPRSKYLRRNCNSRGAKQVWVNENFINSSA